jgi:hypothetical protein
MYDQLGHALRPLLMEQQNSVQPSAQRLPGGHFPGLITAHALSGRSR